MSAALQHSTARIQWIDFSRVLAMYFVVQAHSYMNSDVLHQHPHLTSGAVALFFIISGYFSRFQSLKKTGTRLLAFVLFYLTWGTFTFAVSKHGKLTSFTEWWEYIPYTYGSTMWFIRYLIIATVLIPIFAKFPQLLKWLSAVLLFAIGTYQTLSVEEALICLNPYIALSLFFIGNSLNAFSIPQIEDIFFLKRFSVPTTAIFAFAFSYLLMLYLLGIFDINFKIPYQINIFMTCWAIAALGYSLEALAPGFTGRVASAGPAMVFVLGHHMPMLRMFTSAHIRLIGGYPPYWLTFPFIIALMLGSILIYRRLVGRNSIVDKMLFAR